TPNNKGLSFKYFSALAPDDSANARQTSSQLTTSLKRSRWCNSGSVWIAARTTFGDTSLNSPRSRRIPWILTECGSAVTRRSAVEASRSFASHATNSVCVWSSSITVLHQPMLHEVVDCKERPTACKLCPHPPEAG